MRAAAGLSTKNATGFGITRHLQQVGGSLAVTSDREVISYTVEVTKDNLETGKILEFIRNLLLLKKFVFRPEILRESRYWSNL